MAWASVGNLNTGQNKASSTQVVSGTIGIAMNVGDVIVVSIAADNFSTTDGDNSEVSSVTASTGTNVFVKAGEFTNGNGVAAAGITSSLWFCVLTSALATTATIRANFNNAIVAKGISVWGFTKAAGSNVQVEAKVTTVNDASATLSNATISGLRNTEHLFFRSVASAVTGFGFTATTNYTALGVNTTTGSTADTNIQVAGEFRILSATTDTSSCAPTGTGDRAAVYIALTEDFNQDGDSTRFSEVPVYRAKFRPEPYQFKILDDSPSSLKISHTELPIYRAKFRPPPLAFWLDTDAPSFLAGSQSGGEFTENPYRRRPPLPKGFAGWLNNDNETARASFHTELPVRVRNRIDYTGWSTYNAQDANKEQVLSADKITQVFKGPNKYSYSGFTAGPLSDSSVEASILYSFDLPQRKNKNSYDGWQINGALRDQVFLRQGDVVFDLPVKARNKIDYTGWDDNVATRDETGTFVEIRAGEVHAIPPWVKNRHKYDGWQAAPLSDDVVDPVGQFAFFDLAPRGKNYRDFSGFQNPPLNEQLRQDAVGGFMFDMLPPPSRNNLQKVMRYVGFTGHTNAPTSSDFLPANGKIWRPVIRPRRR